MSPADLLQWLRALQSRSRLTLAARAVGLALALRVNARTGSCYPSKARLASDTGLSEETIRRAVGALVRADLLRVEFSQGRLANRYRLRHHPGNPIARNGDNPLTSEEVESMPTPSPVNPLASEPPRQRGATPSPAPANPLTSDPRKEQKKEHGKEQSLLSGLRPTGERERVPLAEVEELIIHLNAKAGTRFEVRTQAGKLTRGAEDARHRIAEHGLERMKLMIDRKAAEWAGTERAVYLRPATLFRRSNCENYCGQLGTPTPPPGTGTRAPGGTGPEPTPAHYKPFAFE